ncbi:hypothetical protein GCM10009122_21030 [Fulvivirga kasyanovii]
MTACEEEDGNVIDYKPGQHLNVSGPSSVYVGDKEQYYILNNRKELDHIWAIDNGAKITEDSENDAYVYVDFFEPTDHALTVSTSSASGDMSVKVSSREVHFDVDSTLRSETVKNDTVTIPLAIDGGFNGDFDVTYSLSGSMDASRYDVLAGYESPYTISTDSTNHIKLVVYPDVAVTDTLDIVLTIDAVNPVLTHEYIKSDTLQSIVYSFVDDLKIVTLDTATMDITEAGVYSIPVTISKESSETISVAYSITPGVGVSDATVTTTPGVLTFEAGITERNITLSINDNALDPKQTITVSLDGLTTADDEVSINNELDSKELIIDEE